MAERDSSTSDAKIQTDMIPSHIYEQQLKMWVEGRSYHNLIHDLCVPDFSCCHPEMKQEKIVRECFYLAYLQKKAVIWEALLLMFTEAMMAKETGERITLKLN